MAEPCLSCGACCASFRVDFHVADLETTPGGCVPVALTVPVTGCPYRCVQEVAMVYRPSLGQGWVAFLADTLGTMRR